MATMTRRSPSRSRGGAADKIWAVGLVGATCVGLVGTLGLRTAQEAAATAQTPSSTADPSASSQMNVAVSSSGLTQEQLDDYALALESERARLEAYHAELLDAAGRLQEAANSLNQGRVGSVSTSAKKAKKAKKANALEDGAVAGATTRPVSKPVAKPVAKPVPKPAAAPQVAKPQAQTRGS